MAKRNEVTNTETQTVTSSDVATTATASAPVVETNEVKMAALATKHQNVKSKMIRELHADGVSTKEITKLMQLVYPKFIYQHARNVLNQKQKKAD